MTKVIILQPYIAPYRVGLFNAINKYENIDLFLMYFGKPEKRRKWKINKKINFKEIYLNPISFSVTYEKNFAIPNIPYLVKAILKIKPDVLICAPNIEGTLSLVLSKLIKFKTICWTESTDDTEKTVPWLKKKIRSFFHKHIKSYIIPGDKTLSYLKSNNYYQSGDQIYVASNTVDDNLFHVSKENLVNRYEKLKTIKILFSGSLIKRKGIDLLLLALKKLDNYATSHSYQIKILGAGDEIKIPPMKNVKHLGFLSGVEYVNVFLNSHVFVLPSIHDCSPLTMIEAVKTGNIILSSDAVGNSPELVYNNGYIFKSNDVESIFHCLFNVLNTEKNELIKMAQNSLAIGKNITHKKSANIFYSAIHEQETNKITKSSCFFSNNGEL